MIKVDDCTSGKCPEGFTLRFLSAKDYQCPHPVTVCMDTEVHACHRLRMNSVLNARLYSSLKEEKKKTNHVLLWVHACCYTNSPN